MPLARLSAQRSVHDGAGACARSTEEESRKLAVPRMSASGTIAVTQRHLMMVAQRAPYGWCEVGDRCAFSCLANKTESEHDQMCVVLPYRLRRRERYFPYFRERDHIMVTMRLCPFGDGAQLAPTKTKTTAWAKKRMTEVQRLRRNVCHSAKRADKLASRSLAGSLLAGVSTFAEQAWRAVGYRLLVHCLSLFSDTHAILTYF